MLIAARARQLAEGWEVVSFPWWTWLVLAIPGLVLCVDLWLGTGGLGARGRNSALVLLGLIVAGNVAGLALLISRWSRRGAPTSVAGSCS